MKYFYNKKHKKPLPPVPDINIVLHDDEDLKAQAQSETFWVLVWRKFRRHNIAVIGATIALSFYLFSVIFADFIAPYGLEQSHRVYKSAPPQIVRIIDNDGNWHLRPFVYGFRRELDEITFQRVYKPDYEVKIPLRFFVSGEPYRLLGFIPTSIRLFGVDGEKYGVHFWLGQTWTLLVFAYYLWWTDFLNNWSDWRRAFNDNRSDYRYNIRILRRPYR